MVMEETVVTRYVRMPGHSAFLPNKKTRTLARVSPNGDLVCRCPLFLQARCNFSLAARASGILSPATSAIVFIALRTCKRTRNAPNTFTLKKVGSLELCGFGIGYVHRCST
jgi:hypothetical protein